MECRFQVGQKVVCVDNTGLAHGTLPYPANGSVYEIRKVGIDSESELCVWLQGIERFWLGRDYGFYPRRFRPIHETQIEELRQAAIKAAREAKAPRKNRAGQPMMPAGFMR